MAKNLQVYNGKVLKLVHGGQGLCELDNGKKALVWGVLPGEVVEFVVSKKRGELIEGIVKRVLEASPERVEPLEDNYLSTSPWQILAEDKESYYKKEITLETFQRAGVNLPANINSVEPDTYFNYRNKMEYSFYGDDSGLHLALYNRGSHQKQILQSSKIAKPEIDKAASKIVNVLNTKKVRASSLKSLLLRSSKDGTVAAALFVKDENFQKIPELALGIEGLKIIYSNPRSPASVVTKILQIHGSTTLKDQLLGSTLEYDVLSFFQVNITEFTKTLETIHRYLKGKKIVDMYSGVGSIGVTVSSDCIFIESDELNVEFLKKNVSNTSEVIHVKSENAYNHISSDDYLILDPPRAGLHQSLTQKINEILPKEIIYLSCNPSTQARDIERLQDAYVLEDLVVYNYFPRTPHIETLAKLVRR